MFRVYVLMCHCHYGLQALGEIAGILKILYQKHVSISV